MATIARVSSLAPAEQSPATPIAWPLRAWLAVEVLFGVLAISSIALSPQQTATNFAWPIKPDVMAATLGAFYLASALLFVPVLFARTWQDIRATTLPAVGFTLAMLVTTFLHWEKFSVGTAPFYVWFASYLLPPPIFAALYWWHQRRSAPVGLGLTRPVAGWLRAGLVANGALLLGLAVLFYAAPTLLQRIAPWQFTPLTVRTLCGWLIGIGLLQLALAREGDWARMRLGTIQLIALPPMLALQLARFHGQVRWGTPALWVFLIDCVLVAAPLLALWLTMRTGQRGRSDAARGD